MKKEIKAILIILILLILVLFFTRLLNSREIDDIHTLRDCEDEYVEKSDILWVMPLYKNYSIANNKTWCEEISSLNKTLGMHGITHLPYEFKKNISNEKFLEAIKIFEECFGIKPSMFKSPYLKISRENKQLIKRNNLKLRNDFHQITRKVYHCQDSGRFSNKFIDLF